MDNYFFRYLPLWLLTAFLANCYGQTPEPGESVQSSDHSKRVGGGCDGCELMYVGMPTDINAVDTSAGWTEAGQRLLVTGTVYHIDGKTPASDIILYYWQTDHTGYYSPAPGLPKRAKRHGHIRGWVQSDANGKYAIHTIRPASYPDNDIPAHIHVSIKEPDIDHEYYIDEWVFDDDPLLTGARRRKLENRGGSGVLRVLLADDRQVAEHNIILGLHIPSYPKTPPSDRESGLPIGEDNPSFTPYHAWGPDRGTRTCPVCKYGRYQGILYFVGNEPNWDDIKQWLVFLENESTTRHPYLKVYFVYGNRNRYDESRRRTELEEVGIRLKLKTVALTFVPSMTDTETEVSLNQINSEVENTFVVYRQSTIVDKFINLPPTTENFNLLSATLRNTQSDYFDLPELGNRR